MEKKSNLGLEIIYWGLLLMTLYVFHCALHWSGMGIVALCLVPVGIALGIWQIIREKKAGEKMVVVILNFLTKLCLFTGLVFVAQRWPGGGAFMLFAFLLYFVSVAVSSCIAVYKERNEKLYILLLIAILSYSFGALFYRINILEGLQ